MRTSIHVTLADAPRDVLIYLVDHAGWQNLERLALIAPAEAGPYSQVLATIRRALALLDTMGVVEINRHATEGLAARATAAGYVLVEAARAARAGHTWTPGS